MKTIKATQVGQDASEDKIQVSVSSCDRKLLAKSVVLEIK